MRNINKIIIHCSDSDIDSHDDISVIDRWHKERGWAGVGYHYFIQSNGNIQVGRDIRDVGAHAYGHNGDSIGICLHGRNKFTESQFKMLAMLIKYYTKEFSIKEVEGHCHYDSTKTCPNFDVNWFKKKYL
jgi:N-acetyl-anhydromuramyl-L-alanine amidase AmpD